MTKRYRPLAGSTATTSPLPWVRHAVVVLALSLAWPAAAGGADPTETTNPVGINTGELGATSPPASGSAETAGEDDATDSTTASATSSTTSSATASAPPPALLPYTAEYRISYDGLSTTAERSLRKTGNTWHLAQDASIFFLKVSEQAQIEDTPSGLRSQQYQYRNSVSSKRDQNIVFDWQAGVVADRQADKPWQKPLNGNLTDQLGSQLQLRAALINGSFADGFEQTIVKKGKTKTYQYQVLDHETVDSALGKIDTIKLRRYREGSSAESVIWVAKKWNYLIVKLQQIEDDDTFSLELLSATLDGQQLAAQ